MKRIPIVLGLALVLLAVVGSPRAEDREATRWFSVSWTPATDGTIARIRGQVRNTSPYRVTNVSYPVPKLPRSTARRAPGPARRTTGRSFCDLARRPTGALDAR